MELYLFQTQCRYGLIIPVLIDNEEAQNYILDEDVANFISTTGTINSLVEASKIKATARFYKSGRFSPKVYSSGLEGR